MNFWPNLQRLTLNVRGVGNVTSFKNSKMLARGRLITDPKKQKQMDLITQELKSQLSSAFRTIEGGTLTGQYLPCWTALFGQCENFDDSCQWVQEIHAIYMPVENGSEGADITIEFL